MGTQPRTEYSLPLPRMIGLAADLYKYCKAHEVRFQRCTACGTWRHIARDMCANCDSQP